LVFDQLDGKIGPTKNPHGKFLGPAPPEERLKKAPVVGKPHGKPTKAGDDLQIQPTELGNIHRELPRAACPCQTAVCSV